MEEEERVDYFGGRPGASSEPQLTAALSRVVDLPASPLTTDRGGEIVDVVQVQHAREEDAGGHGEQRCRRVEVAHKR